MLERSREGRSAAEVVTLPAHTAEVILLHADVRTSTSLSQPAADFESVFSAAFDQLRALWQSNLFSLEKLRSSLTGYPHADFDRELGKVRLHSDRYVQQSFDGRPGHLTDKLAAAAIGEGEGVYVHVGRREP